MDAETRARIAEVQIWPGPDPEEIAGFWTESSVGDARSLYGDEVADAYERKIKTKVGTIALGQKALTDRPEAS